MEFPRVTEVLRPFTNFTGVSQVVLDRAAARGTTVHALCAGIAKDVWVPDSMIQEELVGYVNSFRQWVAAQVEKFIVIEKRYIDENFGYTGQLDFVVLGKDKKIYLVDIKTSARPQKTYPVQMAAYKQLLAKHNVPIEGVMLVYLDKDGDFPNISTYDNLEEEWAVFRGALDCWKYFNKHKLKGNSDV